MVHTVRYCYFVDMKMAEHCNLLRRSKATKFSRAHSSSSSGNEYTWRRRLSVLRLGLVGCCACSSVLGFGFITLVVVILVFSVLMEAQFGGEVGHAYGPMLVDINAGGRSSLNWDLNDWRWDGDHLLATPYKPVPFDCRSRQVFPTRIETPPVINAPNYLLPSSVGFRPYNDGGSREVEKRHRAVVVLDDEVNGEAGSLNLNLGGQAYPVADEDADNWEGNGGKKTKLSGSPPMHPACQVKGCKADLSSAKDYHRRHKVCDMHSKAAQALVGDVMQRFCQQCSRFHVLQEFDEGKRSCRRRLAGHNKRRRKAQPKTSVDLGSLNDDQGTQLLMSLLRIMPKLNSNSTEQKKDEEMLAHLLKSLVTLAGALNNGSLSGLVQRSQESQDVRVSPDAPQEDLPNADQLEVEPSVETRIATPTNDTLGGLQQAAPAAFQRVNLANDVQNRTETASKRNKLTLIDLNKEYDGSEDIVDNQDNCASLDCLVREQDRLKSSPPQTSGNSDSTFARSPSSSSGSEPQSRTDRIIFKLLGKDPNDLPHLLRGQILDWLSHSPTDIEGYIRPGCIVLTIYIRLEKSSWDELCYDLGSSLSRLLDLSDDPFWRTGWIFTRVRNHVAFICDGEVVLDTPIPSTSSEISRISSISPLAVSASQKVQFVIKGSNLSPSSSRFLCALEGDYLALDGLEDPSEGDHSFIEHENVSCLRLSCSIPNVTGRGFIEVDNCGLGRSFFPFIVAEPDVCSEICKLESMIELEETDENHEKTDARNQALDFLHEIGWLLHRNSLGLRSPDASSLEPGFPFERAKHLLNFSIEHDWCAVVKKLLDIVFCGTVASDTGTSVEKPLLEIGLLPRAVQRNSRPMVESLLRYIPETVAQKVDCNQAESNQEKQQSSTSGFLFRPDDVGPGGLTPLHIAASSEGCEKVLEALIEDPGKIGIGAWKSARDSTGLTPYEYACLRGHYSYVHLVQRKINKLQPPEHVVVDIPTATSGSKSELKQGTPFHTEKSRAKPKPASCGSCERKLSYGYTRTALTYRPAMLSMLTIAAAIE
ncbi:Squamosa promoter-binding-like protein [Drosera capensis]